jgi:hypothetical protein
VLKAVIDTNVLISSLYGGNPRRIINLWRNGRFALCTSEKIEREYSEVLARFTVSREGAEELLAMLSARKNVYFTTPLTIIHEIIDDPDDDIFLECAVAAEADIIISGDRHLLDLEVFRGIQIVDPAQFIRSFWD